MPVKLFVRKTSDTSIPDEYVFEEDVITIGREGGNSLTLPDPKRSVSRRHAEIRCLPDAYQLVDLESKNFTYLNGERLHPHRPRDLQNGDLLQIGDFELRFEELVPAVQADDRTVFDASFINPFEEDAQNLIAAFNRLCQTYEQESPARRADALKDALDMLMVEQEPVEAKAQVAGALGVEQAEPFDPDATAVPGSRPAPVSRPAPPPPVTDQTASTGAASSYRLPSADASRQERLLQVLLGTVGMLAGVPGQFRYEFIGHTLVQPADHEFLTADDPKAMAEHLLDPSISEDDFSRRVEILSEALETVRMHQVAVLEGYKASVKAGAEALLNRLSPDEVIEEVNEEKAMFRFGPMAKQEAFDRLAERIDELRKGDWTVAERRIYRPEFIRAYLARMMSPAS